MLFPFVVLQTGQG